MTDLAVVVVQPQVTTTVVTPVVSPVQVNSSVPGSYGQVALLGLGLINPKDPTYGATGDGTTDDTTALTNAMAAVADGGGFYLPPGSYLLSTPLSIPHNNIQVFGPGTLKLSASFASESHGNKGAIDANGLSGVAVRDLAVDCTLASNASGVKFTDCTDFLIDSVRVFSPATLTAASGYGAWVFGASSKGTVRNCYVSGAGYSSLDCSQGSLGAPDGIIFTGNISVDPKVNGIDMYRSTRLKVIGNTFVGGTGTDAAMRFTGGTSGQPNQGSVIQGNTITGCPTIGIVALNTAKNDLILGNTINSAGTKGIVLSGSGVVECRVTQNMIYGAADNGIEDSGTDNDVEGNTITDTSGEYGILATGATRPKIRNNTILRSGKHGVHVLNCTDALVANNYCKDASQATDNTYDGINNTTSDRTHLIANTCRYDNTLTKQQRRGLVVLSGNDCIAENNDLQTSGKTGNFADAATGTIVRYNTGAIGLNVRSVTADTTVTAGDNVITVDTTAGNVTVTIPAVANAKGQWVVIKKISSDSNVVTISGDTVDGRSSLSILFQFQSFTLFGGTTQWRVLATSTPSFLLNPSSADNGDAGVSVTWGLSSPVQVWNTVLSAPRTGTLQTTAAFNGARFRFVRTAAATGSTLTIGGVAVPAGSWIEFDYNGSAWYESAKGTL